VQVDLARTGQTLRPQSPTEASETTTLRTVVASKASLPLRIAPSRKTAQAAEPSATATTEVPPGPTATAAAPAWALSLGVEAAEVVQGLVEAAEDEAGDATASDA
jgi:hypothetical protein